MSRNTGRPRKTLTDHLVTMICPVLIMAMTGSLVFFLIEVGYDGRFDDRLRWVMFWFVVAAVLIARISIQQGSTYAGLYALGLGTVTLMWLDRFVGLVPLIVILIVLIWLCAHKLTWDCTFLDDESPNEESLLGEEAEADETTLEEEDQDEDRPKKKRKNRRPGLWVIWFSLGALPTFGIGQAIGGPADDALKVFGFKLLGIYLAAGLGLLVATSFLNVRRYLRKHFLRMPARVTRMWLMAGGILSIFLLAGVLLLPRPNASYSLNTLIDQTSDMVQEASEHAFFDWDPVEDDDVSQKVPPEEDDEPPAGDDKGDGEEGENGMEEKSEDGEPSGSDGEEGEGKSGEGKEGESSQGKGEGAASQSVGEGEGEGESESGESESGENGEGDQSNMTQPEMPSHSSSWIGTVVKVLIWLILGGVFLFFAIKNRKALLKAFKQLVDDLLSLFGKKKKKTQFSKAKPKRQSLYADFRNPFLSGMADRWSPEELIGYTWQAVKAWAHDRHVIEGEGKTPKELAEEIAEKAPEIGEVATETAELYTRLAFTQYGLPKSYLLSLKKLWAKIS